MTAAPYSGISTYCYANSLHMSLRGAGAASLPDVGFIECLTTMPFGKLYLRLPAGGLLFFSPAAVSPESGLDRALAAMGWECRRWTGGSEVALAMLKEELTTGPCLVGPLEMGLLTHTRGCPPGRSAPIITWLSWRRRPIACCSMTPVDFRSRRSRKWIFSPHGLSTASRTSPDRALCAAALSSFGSSPVLR